MFYITKRFTNILLLITALFFINSCDLFDSNGVPDQVDKLHTKFHGTWQPVYSLSELPIDGNLDGQSSTYMIEELTNFQNGFLDINIRKDRLEEGNYPYLVYIPYPVQNFPLDIDLNDPNFYINYDMKSMGFPIKFSPDQKNMLIDDDVSSQIDQDEYPLPESIEIKNNGLLIVVVIEKKLLTSEGWKTVTIRTRYARTSESN